jgi:hypothetical protein
MMFAQFTELIIGGIQQGTKRLIVVNLQRIITFREGPHDSGCILETRRGDIHVEETYDQLKTLFNTKNGLPPVLIPKESWQENISNPIIDEN